MPSYHLYSTAISVCKCHSSIPSICTQESHISPEQLFVDITIGESKQPAVSSALGLIFYPRFRNNLFHNTNVGFSSPHTAVTIGDSKFSDNGEL